MKEAYLAIDFGGGSGRVIAGCLSEGELVLDTIYRFPNRQVRMGGHVYWDFLSLFEDMKTGIRMAVEKGYTLKSIGIDTWGVDFGLIDKQESAGAQPIPSLVDFLLTSAQFFCLRILCENRQRARS